MAASNEPGGTKRALRSRLTPIEFDPYSQQELKEIAQRIAESEGFQISPQGANLLAGVAQGSPRTICRRVRNLKHFWAGSGSVTLDQVRCFLDSEGIDEHGFTPHQREYLRRLAAMPGGQCNLERLAIRLGCDTAHVRQEIEPFLIERGFVDPTSRLGRGVTEAGRAVVSQFDTGRCTDKEE